jgi:zinc transport system substrate-binding protein
MSRHAQPLQGSKDGEADPHVWLSPAVMRDTAREVASALETLDPGAGGIYRGNLAGVLADIEAVDGDLRRALAGLAGRRFLVYHPEWGYFARAYGLEQVAIEAGGKEPSARRLVELGEAARRDGVRGVFIQRGYAEQPARAIAQELGARVVAIDAMAADWPANLRRVGAQVREAIGG